MAGSSDLPAWPPALDAHQIKALSSAAIDYALSHSIVYRPPAASSMPPLDSTIHAPISLLPSPFPSALFEASQSLQPLYNDLYARITLDDQFLHRVIGGNVILVDAFQARLYRIWKETEAQGLAPTLHLGLLRSDYLLHRDEHDERWQLKQVELNTISASFGSLSTRVSELHRHLFRSTKFFGVSSALSLDRLPINRALETLAAGLAAGHRTYLERNPPSSTTDAQPIILFVVQETERNAFDQRLIEYSLMEQHGIQVRRASLAQVARFAVVDQSTRRLTLRQAEQGPEEEVAVVYFRAGYGPGDYPSEVEWSAREMLEQSLAIKCPTIALQLAGAKKVQQVLSDPGVLESFVQQSGRGRIWSDEEVAHVRNSFMPMYGMEDNGRGIEIASDPNASLQYVLKPQREGGGNNVYRDAIVPALEALDQEDQQEQRQGGTSSSPIKRREGYILMKLIEPPTHVGNYLLRHGSTSTIEGQVAAPRAVLAPQVISELGAFGAILFERGRGEAATTTTAKVVFEQSGGHLLRTKASESNEGGVAAGFSVIDSPLLV